jgi:hypothetical protein
MVRAKSKSQNIPTISVPTPEDERFRFGKVGIMGTLGLAIGIVWPSLAGFHLVPPPPSEAPPAPSGSAVPTGASEPSATIAAAKAASAVTKPPDDDQTSAGVRPPKVVLAQVVNCRSKDAGRQTHCDTPAIDTVVDEPLRALIACDGAENLHGVLSLGFDVDFDNNKLDNFVAGKSTTLPSNLAKQLVRCAEKELGRVSLEGVNHPMTSYRVFYRLEFGAEPGPAVGTKTEKSEAAAPPASGEVVAASGRVTVTWDAALVRTKPKDGEILARVLGGTRLTVTAHQGDWYRVKYDAKGSEGWVFKAAIGL